jgi:hypothetical protein
MIDNTLFDGSILSLFLDDNNDRISGLNENPFEF